MEENRKEMYAIIDKWVSEKDINIKKLIDKPGHYVSESNGDLLKSLIYIDKHGINFYRNQNLEVSVRLEYNEYIDFSIYPLHGQNLDFRKLTQNEIAVWFTGRCAAQKLENGWLVYGLDCYDTVKEAIKCCIGTYTILGYNVKLACKIEITNEIRIFLEDGN